MGNFISSLISKVKAFLFKYVSLSETLYKKFSNSKESNRILDIYNSSKDRAALEKAVKAYALEEVQILIKDNPELTQKAIDCFVKLVLSQVK